MTTVSINDVKIVASLVDDDPVKCNRSMKNIFFNVRFIYISTIKLKKELGTNYFLVLAVSAKDGNIEASFVNTELLPDLGMSICNNQKVLEKFIIIL